MGLYDNLGDKLFYTRGILQYFRISIYLQTKGAYNKKLFNTLFREILNEDEFFSSSKCLHTYINKFTERQ